MKKRNNAAICLIFGVIIGLMLAIPSGSAASTMKQLNAMYRDIKVIVNGIQIDPRDVIGDPVEPFIVDGTVYVPVRAISEALGMEVEWIGEESTVNITNPNNIWANIKPEAAETPPEPSNHVTVSNVEELAAAIADDTYITLKEGVYDVAELGEYTLFISGVTGLTLEADGEVEIVTPNRYSEVIQIADCNGITLKGIKAGHSVTGEYECDSGVVYLDRSCNIVIEDCYLYGCGSVGITMYNCAAVDVRDTIITDCSLYGVYMWNCSGIEFTDCKLIDNRAYANVISGFNVSAVFTGCEISGNRNLLWGAVDVGDDVLFDSCVFTDNAIDEDSGYYAHVISGAGISMKNCVIEEEGFNLGHWSGVTDLGGNELR